MKNNEEKIQELKSKIEHLITSQEAVLGLGVFYLLKMNQTPKDSVIEELSQENLKLSRVEQILKSLCPHSGKKINKNDSAACEYCGEYLEGWWCPQSPDNSCYYFSEEKEGSRIVKLEDGREVPLAASHVHKYETDDCCLFCGQPEERK